MSSASSGFTKRSIYYGWIPATPVIHQKFLKDHFGATPEDGDPPVEHSEPVKAFLKVLDDAKTTDDITRLFDGAVAQANEYHKIQSNKRHSITWADPNEAFKVKDFQDFLIKVDKIVVGPPKFYKAKVDGHTTIGEPIGVPLYLIFDLISNTTAAYTLLTRKDFNLALKALLDKWGSYLKGPGSNQTLTREGWFSTSPASLALLESGLGKLSSDQTYVSDNAQDPKYNSWDSFFTRQFHDEYTDTHGKPPKVRPIPAQPSGPNVPFYIYSPCESTVFRTAANVQLHDTFWLKSQKYSLFDVFGGYPRRNDLSSHSFLPKTFIAGTAPFDVVASGVIDGTYYAVLPDEGAAESDPDLLPGDPHGAMIQVRSQPWLSVTTTRAVFIIQPTDKKSPIDLIAFVAIGMVEVSSCEITYDKRHVPNPKHVEVEDELGKFHFGGSSYTLVVKLKTGHEVIFQDIYNSPVRPGQHRWIHSVVG